MTKEKVVELVWASSCNNQDKWKLSSAIDKLQPPSASITAAEGAPRDALVELVKTGVAYETAKSRLQDFFHAHTEVINFAGARMVVLFEQDFDKVCHLILEEAFRDAETP